MLTGAAISIGSHSDLLMQLSHEHFLTPLVCFWLTNYNINNGGRQALLMYNSYKQ